MKATPLLAAAAVLLAVGGVLLARHWAREPEPLPSFTPVRPPLLERLEPPWRPAAKGAPLAGTVVDPQGRPVADATVQLLEEGIPRWSITGPDGRFELARASDAGGELVVAAWGFPVSLHAVDAGAAQVELTLPEPSPPPPGLPEVERSDLRGRVAPQTATAAPRRYEVALLPVEPPSRFGGAVARRAPAQSDGTFAFDELAHGAYRVLVLPEWARGGTWPDLVAPESALLEHAGASDPSAEGERVVSLSEGSLEGRVVDADGQPLDGALLLLAPADDPARIWPPGSTGPTGRFRFDDLPPGPYLLQGRAGAGVSGELPVDVQAGRARRVDLPPIEARAASGLSSEGDR